MSLTALQIALTRSPCPDDPHLRALIALAEAQTGTQYGDLRPTAVALLALHWKALEARGSAGASGTITSESEGELSRSYATSQSASGSDFLKSTRWGEELLALRRGTNLSFMTRRTSAIG